MKNNTWHTWQAVDVIKELGTSKEGLSKEEVKKRILTFGKNELPKKKRESIFNIILRQLIDPIILMMILAVIFSFIAQEVVDGFAISMVILVNLIMGAFQEWKAGKNAESLATFIRVKVKVRRDNIEMEVDSSELVVGDIILLESGNKISADARILESRNLVIDESVLTGESMGVSKDPSLLSDVFLAERKNMIYAGTSVLTGRATCIVTETGIHTEIGQIADTVSHTKETKSPLVIRMEKLSKQISLLVIGIAIILIVLLLAKNVPSHEIFLTVIALSVSVMPEGLPLALTMALTIASNRMSKKNVIVKRLNAVESLGSCSVIASDKTGTLTVNQQTAKKIILPNGEFYEIGGTGYNDIGDVTSAYPLTKAIEIGRLGLLNNEASLSKKEGTFIHFGDSVDIAFLSLAEKVKASKENTEIISHIHYESENKYAGVFYTEGNRLYSTIKGSLEKVLEFCTYMDIDGEKKILDKEKLIKQNDALASQGYRIIALAKGEVKTDQFIPENPSKSLQNLTFAGMVAFIDPIREDAKKSVEECRTAGIKVIMITGDHPLTAFAISKELGLTNTSEEVTTGIEVASFLQKGKEAFDAFVKSKKVFTRVTPLDKLQIVESYKRQGEFVAVTGDGVNDAPALKAANIGVAMGSGTDVAKETASLIVLDDTFSSIVAGVKEGRSAYSNIRKVSYLLLSCGMAEVFFFLFSIILNLPMPLVAIQLLWLNIVTNGLQDFALSFEKSEDRIMREKVSSPKDSIFNKKLLIEVLLSGFTIGCIVLGVWIYLLRGVHMDVNRARGYIMTLMVFLQNMHVFNCRSERRSAFKVPLTANPLIVCTVIGAVVLQMFANGNPTFGSFLKTMKVPIVDVLLLFALSTVILWVMELYKKIYVRKKEGQDKMNPLSRTK